MRQELEVAVVDERANVTTPELNCLPPSGDECGGGCSLNWRSVRGGVTVDGKDGERARISLN